MSGDLTDSQWLLYGAYGFTGRLTAEVAVERGHRPILAGRNREKLSKMAGELGLEFRTFSLTDSADVAANLGDIDLVLHQAGPFSSTARPMVEACLRSKTHYLDITGEISVLQDIYDEHERAVEQGVVLLPGVGFDVVPTDFLAERLSYELPDANRLELAIMASGGRVSPGTALSAVERLGQLSAVRINGVVCDVPFAWKVREIPFASRTHFAGSIPSGDLVSAHRTTGIETITVYLAMPEAVTKVLRRLSRARGFLARSTVQSILKKLVRATIEGPDDDVRATASNEIWGEVRNALGERVSATLRTPEGYHYTSEVSVRAVERVFSEDTPPGAHTPSSAFSRDFLEDVPGVEFYDIVSH